MFVYNVIVFLVTVETFCLLSLFDTTCLRVDLNDDPYSISSCILNTCNLTCRL